MSVAGQQHRGPAVDHLIGVNPAAVARPGSGDRRRNDLVRRSGLECLKETGIGSVGNQDTQLAALEALGAILDDAQRRGGIEILTCRHGSVCRLWHLLQTKFAGDLVGQRLIDVQEMRDHPFPDRRCLNLADFERKSGSDMRPLSHGLTDKELTRLAIMVGEALGAQTTFGALFDVGE